MHWMQTEMPCKHLFAVMRYYSITWEQLPEQFRWVNTTCRNVTCLCHKWRLLTLFVTNSYPKLLTCCIKREVCYYILSPEIVLLCLLRVAAMLTLSQITTPVARIHLGKNAVAPGARRICTIHLSAKSCSCRWSNAIAIPPKYNRFWIAI